MKRPVRWSRNALDDLKSQISFIAKRNPTAARNVADRILAACASLETMATGRRGRISGTYERLVTNLPYIVAYSITTERGHEVVSILRVIHTSRDWRSDAWPD